MEWIAYGESLCRQTVALLRWGFFEKRFSDWQAVFTRHVRQVFGIQKGNNTELGWAGCEFVEEN